MTCIETEAYNTANWVSIQNYQLHRLPAQYDFPNESRFNRPTAAMDFAGATCYYYVRYKEIWMMSPLQIWHRIPLTLVNLQNTRYWSAYICSTLLYRPPRMFDIHMWMMSLSSNLISRASSFCQLALVDTLYILTIWRIQVCCNISTVTSTNLPSGWNPYRHPSSDTITTLGARDRSWALLQSQCLIYSSLLSSS